MVHGDDKGLVLPPRVAPLQAVVIPIPHGKADPEVLDARCRELEAQLCAMGVRVEFDHRRNYRPGWKYNWWELKGVPLRIEVGPRDLERGTCRVVRRDTGNKVDCEQAQLAPFVVAELERMQSDMLSAARARRDA